MGNFSLKSRNNFTSWYSELQDVGSPVWYMTQNAARSHQKGPDHLRSSRSWPAAGSVIETHTQNSSISQVKFIHKHMDQLFWPFQQMRKNISWDLPFYFYSAFRSKATSDTITTAEWVGDNETMFKNIREMRAVNPSDLIFHSQHS